MLSGVVVFTEVMVVEVVVGSFWCSGVWAVVVGMIIINPAA